MKFQKPLMSATALVLMMSATFTLTSCHYEIVGDRTLSSLHNPLPAQRGIWHVLVDSAFLANNPKYTELCNPPCKMISTYSKKAKISADSLKLKGKWFTAYWKGNQLYLKVKRNRKGKRIDFLGFKGYDAKGTVAPLVVQAGKK